MTTNQQRSGPGSHMSAEPIVVRGVPGHVYAATRLSRRHRPLHLARCWCWRTDPAPTWPRLMRWVSLVIR